MSADSPVESSSGSTAAFTEATFFFAAGLLATFGFVYRGPEPHVGEPELIFLLAVLGLTAIVYFAARHLTRLWAKIAVLVLLLAVLMLLFLYAIRTRSPDHPTTEIVADLLRTAGSSLGPEFRIYLLRLEPASDDAERFFSVVDAFNVADPKKLNKRMHLATPGVGQVYLSRPHELHLTSDGIDRAVFSDASHLWLASVVPSGSGRCCVLIVESTRADLTQSQIAHAQVVTSQLAGVLARYGSSRFPTF